MAQWTNAQDHDCGQWMVSVIIVGVLEHRFHPSDELAMGTLMKRILILFECDRS